MIISGNSMHRALFEVLHEHLGLHWSDDFRAMAQVPNEFHGHVMQQDHLTGVIGYNGFVGRVCCMHSYIPHPERITREFVHAMFDYPFNTCGVTSIFAMVDSVNNKAIELDLHVGFTEVNRFKDGGLDGDLVLLQMRKQDCRWLKGMKHGQEIRTASA